MLEAFCNVSKIVSGNILNFRRDLFWIGFDAGGRGVCKKVASVPVFLESVRRTVLFCSIGTVDV